MTEDSTFLFKEPCPKCGSRDNLARYSDGHGHCFGCGHYEPGDGEPQQRKPRMSNALQGLDQCEYIALTKRKITEETCRKFGYVVAGQAQIAPYFNAAGEMVGQKIRRPNKEFVYLGGQGLLFGQQLWGQGGKMVVVTEGEIDAMSVSQLQGNKWPVVSVPNGAQGAKKALARHLEWLQSYETVVIMFDSDGAGRDAAQECAELFRPGTAKIATLPLKDPNEMLQAGRGAEVISAIWNAKIYRPDGILSGAEMLDLIMAEDTTPSVPYPWLALQGLTHGIRQSELVTICAGSGIGKSAIVREISYSLLKAGETVGMIMLEESAKRTALGLLGIELNKPIHISKEGVSDEQIKAAFEATLGSDRVYLYDHFGSTDIGNLLSRVRYMARALGCRWVILDHLSIVVSGLGDGDERRLIDNAMTALRTLVQETGIGLILVSHLKRPEGKGHEDGASVSLSQLRGSAAIAQLSDMVIGAERDQQGNDPNLTTLRVLKNRFSGQTGVAGCLRYSQSTGRLTEGSPQFGDETKGDDF